MNAASTLARPSYFEKTDGSNSLEMEPEENASDLLNHFDVCRSRVLAVSANYVAQGALFKLGAEPQIGFQKYVNQYSTNEYALSAVERQQRHKKSLYMSQKYSLLDDGLFKWPLSPDGSIVAGQKEALVAITGALANMAKNVPFTLMHRKWKPDVQSQWLSEVRRCATGASAAKLLALYELCARRLVFIRAFHCGLGHTRVCRISSDDRDRTKRLEQTQHKRQRELAQVPVPDPVKRPCKMSNDLESVKSHLKCPANWQTFWDCPLADPMDEGNNVVWVKYTKLKQPPQLLCKLKDEQYRVNGFGALGGWLWVSKFRKLSLAGPDSANQRSDRMINLQSVVDQLSAVRERQYQVEAECYSPICRQRHAFLPISGPHDIEQQCYSSTCRDELRLAMELAYDTPGKACAAADALDKKVSGPVRNYGRTVPFPVPKVHGFRRSRVGGHSILVLPRANLRRMARTGGCSENVLAPGFMHSSKANAQVWPYPSSRPLFETAWRYHLQSSNGRLHSVALQLRMLHACVRWAELRSLLNNRIDNMLLDVNGIHVCKTIMEDGLIEYRQVVLHRERPPWGLETDFEIRARIQDHDVQEDQQNQAAAGNDQTRIDKYERIMLSYGSDGPQYDEQPKTRRSLRTLANEASRNSPFNKAATKPKDLTRYSSDLDLNMWEVHEYWLRWEKQCAQPAAAPQLSVGRTVQLPMPVRPEPKQNGMMDIGTNVSISASGATPGAPPTPGPQPSAAARQALHNPYARQYSRQSSGGSATPGGRGVIAPVVTAAGSANRGVGRARGRGRQGGAVARGGAGLGSRASITPQGGPSKLPPSIAAGGRGGGAAGHGGMVKQVMLELPSGKHVTAPPMLTQQILATEKTGKPLPPKVSVQVRQRDPRNPKDSLIVRAMARPYVIFRFDIDQRPAAQPPQPPPPPPPPQQMQFGRGDLSPGATSDSDFNPFEHDDDEESNASTDSNNLDVGGVESSTPVPPQHVGPDVGQPRPRKNQKPEYGTVPPSGAARCAYWARSHSKQAELKWVTPTVRMDRPVTPKFAPDESQFYDYINPSYDPHAQGQNSMMVAEQGRLMHPTHQAPRAQHVHNDLSITQARYNLTQTLTHGVLGQWTQNDKQQYLHHGVGGSHSQNEHRRQSGGGDVQRYRECEQLMDDLLRTVDQVHRRDEAERNAQWKKLAVKLKAQQRQQERAWDAVINDRLSYIRREVAKRRYRLERHGEYMAGITWTQLDPYYGRLLPIVRGGGSSQLDDLGPPAKVRLVDENDNLRHEHDGDPSGAVGTPEPAPEPVAFHTVVTSEEDPFQSMTEMEERRAAESLLQMEGNWNNQIQLQQHAGQPQHGGHAPPTQQTYTMSHSGNGEQFLNMGPEVSTASEGLSRFEDRDGKLNSEVDEHQKAAEVQNLLDPSKLHCVCRTRYDPTRFYLACSLCGKWYHGSCVGISSKKARKMDEFLCLSCNKQPGQTQPVQIQQSDNVYCSCKTPYDDTQFYVGCDRCDDWFHPRCVGITQEDAVAMDSYACPQCQDDAANCRAEKVAELELTRDDYPLLWRLVEALKEHRTSWPFRDPVDSTRYPQYFRIIKRPMDLRKVSEKLESLDYRCLADFVADLGRIFENARVFNAKHAQNSPVCQCASILEKRFDENLAQLKAQLARRHPEFIP